MKKIGALILILISLSGFAQKPEKVYSIVQELREESWYKEQADLWKKEIDKDNQNAVAWYNYYSAIRALQNISCEDQKLVQKYAKLGEQIVKDAYAAIPNSFEANHIM